MKIKIELSDEEIRKIILEEIRLKLNSFNQYSDLDEANLKLSNNIDGFEIQGLTAYYNYVPKESIE